MATASTSAHAFSLFPTTVPRISIPNPHKRNPSLHRMSVMTSPDNGLSPNGESIVVRMEEEPPVPQFPGHLSEQHQQRDPIPSPEDIGRAVTTTSPIDGKTPTQTMFAAAAPAQYTPSIYQSPTFHASSPQPSGSLGTTSATTLVAQTAVVIVGATKTPVDPSPIVPIRSMFPIYQPSVPLSQQPYVPQRPLPAHLSTLSPFMELTRNDNRSSLSMPFVAAAQRTAPASIVNFPSDVMSVNVGPRISTQKELERLWDASHGTEPGFAIKTFDLEMARTAEATFVLGAHPSLPFYTLQTYDTNEIAISKTCPKRRPDDTPSETRDLVLCPLEPSSRRLPPNDGLVAFIFPKLAALMAITQSAALARQHNLAPTDRDDIEAQAVRKAANQEACNLRFNARGGFYELEHPAIGRDDVAGDFAMTSSPLLSSPMTIRSITGKPVLHVLISSESPLPTITVVDPNASRRTGIMTPASTVSPGAGMRRLSTVPLPDSSAGVGLSNTEHPPLAALDLTSQTLHIDANAILELMPSLFSIDCVVCAILAVAVADAKTNNAMGSMEICKPRPPPSSRFGGVGARSLRGGGTGTRPGSVKSYAGSVFYATIAEREGAEEEAKMMRQTYREDVRGSSTKSKSKFARAWFGLARGASPVSDEEELTGTATTAAAPKDEKTSRKGKKGKKGKTKKVTMREFDLEKLGHYQAGDRKGEELPAVTRSALGGLVVALKMLVWLLTLVVQVLAWLLVNVSRAVTSEKF